MFDQGTVTFRVCRLPESLPEDAIDKFKMYCALPLDNVTDEPQWGWVTARHLLDTNITEESIKINGYYHLCLRQAVRKVPASLLNAECRIEELSRLAASGQEHISKKERKEIKADVQQRLLPQMPPQLSGTYIAIDYTENLLYTTAASQHALDILIGYFSKTFGFEPIPMTAEMAASEMFGIDPASVPSMCISPLLNLSDGEGNGTIGENFLTWLWFYQEARGGMLPPSKLGEFALMVDGPLAFVSQGNGAFESVVRKGTPTISAEAKAALTVGKKLKSCKFILAQDQNQEWSCTVDANEFLFRSLKLPEGDAMDPESIFEERMSNIYTFHSVFFALFEKYLKEMSEANKANEYKEKAKEWIAHKEEK